MTFFLLPRGVNVSFVLPSTVQSGRGGRCHMLRMGFGDDVAAVDALTLCLCQLWCVTTEWVTVGSRGRAGGLRWVGCILDPVSLCQQETKLSNKGQRWHDCTLYILISEYRGRLQWQGANRTRHFSKGTYAGAPERMQIYKQKCSKTSSATWGDMRSVY